MVTLAILPRPKRLPPPLAQRQRPRTRGIRVGTFPTRPRESAMDRRAASSLQHSTLPILCEQSLGVAKADCALVFDGQGRLFQLEESGLEVK
jgi:hypothetical protein